MRNAYIGFAVLLAVIVLPGLGKAQSSSELQDRIQLQNKAISDLEAEIRSFQQQLTTLSKEKDTLANAVKILNLESQKLGADIRVTESKIASTNGKLSTLGVSIKRTGDTIDELRDAIGKNLRDLNTKESVTLTELLIQGKSLSELWQDVAQNQSLRESIREHVGALGATKEVLIFDKSEVEAVKNDLIKLQSQLRDQQQIVRKNQTDKSSLLSATKNQESAYAKLVAQKQAQKTALEAELREYESKLKYVNNPGSLPTPGSRPFIWPVDNVRITQQFGKTSASGRLYASGSHNGMDFGAPTGTPVKAMASGVVVDSGNADLTCKGVSYGIWVLIKYDNGLSSVYGHLSLSKVSAGQRVRTGDVVAYVGSTGYSTGPHLHLSVFPADGVDVTSFPSKSCPGKSITIPTAATNAYLDPMVYLPK